MTLAPSDTQTAPESEVAPVDDLALMRQRMASLVASLRPEAVERQRTSIAPSAKEKQLIGAIWPLVKGLSKDTPTLAIPLPFLADAYGIPVVDCDDATLARVASLIQTTIKGNNRAFDEKRPAGSTYLRATSVKLTEGKERKLSDGTKLFIPAKHAGCVVVQLATVRAKK
jgi:hypothetical protein